MAAKQYIDLADLTLFKQLYDTKVASDIATAEAKSLHTVTITGNTLKFYRAEEPIQEGATPDYSITLPSFDPSTIEGEISELQDLIGEIPQGATAQDIVGYIQEYADGAVEDAIADLDTDSDVTIASVSNGVVTIAAGISETDGIIGAGSGTAVTLAKAATTGAAEDISITDSSSYFTSTDVEGALAELAQASAGGVASKTVYLQDESAGQASYAKVYKLYQGANAPDHATDPAALIGTINIPKDLVVQSGKVVTVEDGVDSDGETTSVADGTYVKLTIQNQSEKIYINVADLVDAYTAQQNATQVQLAISDQNVISATIVAGSVTATELAADAVTTVKIADDAVTADKVSIAAHTESKTAGADGIAVSVTTTDGQVSAVTASIAANTYDAYGAASTVSTNLIGTSSDAATANTIYGAKAYADAATESVPTASIQALFSSGE